MFDSAAQSGGNLAGVFEYDGDTGYFYLYRTKGEEGRKVVVAIWILNGTPDFSEKMSQSAGMRRKARWGYSSTNNFGRCLTSVPVRNTVGSIAPVLNPIYHERSSISSNCSKLSSALGIQCVPFFFNLPFALHIYLLPFYLLKIRIHSCEFVVKFYLLLLMADG